LRKTQLGRINFPYSNSDFAIAGQVRMDLEPGRIRVHEHAETGKSLAAYKLHGTRKSIGAG